MEATFIFKSVFDNNVIFSLLEYQKMKRKLFFIGILVLRSGLLVGQNIIDTLDIKDYDLEEVIVKDRTLFDATKIEFRIVKPKDQEAPITKNYIKNLPGVNKSKEDFKYLNRTILYYLDGAKVEESVLNEILTNSLEKLEIYVSPTPRFWMKPGEVIFNFISKKVKAPKSGLNLNSTVGLLIPYNYGSLNYYYIDKKFNFRISSLLYTHKNFENSVDNKQFNGANSTTKKEGHNQVTPNFNNFVFNYFIDSTSTISFQHLNNLIQSNNHSKFTYQLFSDPAYLFSSTNSSYHKTEFDNWLTFHKKSHFITFNYRISNTVRNVLFQAKDLIEQQIEDKNEHFNLNYSNTLAVKGGLLTYNLSFEKLNATSDFKDYAQNRGGSVFNSGFWSGKFIYQKTIKDLNINLGFRLDLLNQLVETKPISDPFGINQLVFLPTLSLNLSTEKHGDFIFSLNQDYSIPEITRLSNFSKQLNPFEITRGNNRLQNERKLEVGLSHYYSNDNVNFASSVNYEIVNDYLGYGPFVSTNNLFFQTYSNIGSYKKLNLNTSLTLQLTDKISNQFSVNHSINNYRLNDDLQFREFDSKWNFQNIISNSTYFTLSKSLETSLDLSYTNINYTFFSKTRFSFPSVSINLDANLGKEWYTSLFFNTIFTNANLSTESIVQPKYSSALTLYQKGSNIEIGIRKIFGNKNGRINEPKRGFEGTNRQIKKD
ncbi:outer membrane beta-barrel protein [Aquirufa regiilacus]